MRDGGKKRDRHGDIEKKACELLLEGKEKRSEIIRVLLQEKEELDLSTTSLPIYSAILQS
jgi:hypothetical protein